MASLFGLGRKKENEVENEARNDGRNVTSGTGNTGTGTGSGDCEIVAGILGFDSS